MEGAEARVDKLLDEMGGGEGVRKTLIKVLSHFVVKQAGQIGKAGSGYTPQDFMNATGMLLFLKGTEREQVEIEGGS